MAWWSWLLLLVALGLSGLLARRMAPNSRIWLVTWAVQAVALAVIGALLAALVAGLAQITGAETLATLLRWIVPAITGFWILVLALALIRLRRYDEEPPASS